jgi:hypothetical protein
MRFFQIQYSGEPVPSVDPVLTQFGGDGHASHPMPFRMWLRIAVKADQFAWAAAASA